MRNIEVSAHPTISRFAWHNPERSGLLLAAALAMIASVVMVIVKTRHFYFFSDDFLNFIIAADMGLSRRYLLRDVFGQFVPLYRLSNWIYLRLFGLQFWPFRVFLVAFEWSAIGLMVRLGWSRGVGLSAIAPMLAVLAFSPVFVTTYQWWSAALSVLTSAVASLACIILAAQDEPPVLSRKLAAAACFLAGLLFYPKGLFTVILLLAIRLFFRASSGQKNIRPMLLESLRDLWPTLVAVPVYLRIVHHGHYSSHVVHPDLALLARFILVGWNSGFLTATLGLHYGTLGLAAANLLVFGLMIWSVVRNPVCLILWGGFALYFVISIGVVGWNRVVPFGIESAEIGRYYADIFCFFLAFLMVVLGQSAVDRRPVSRPSMAAAAFATVFASVHLLNAGALVPHLWYAGPDRPAAFVAHVRTALFAAGEETAIADGVLPGYIMPAWTSPLNRYRFFLPLFGWHGKIADHPKAARSFDQDGNLLSRG